MRFFKRKNSYIVKSVVQNILATLVIFLIVGSALDMFYGIIVSFIIYSVLMYMTFVKDDIRFGIEDSTLYFFKGRKVVSEYDLRGKKIEEKKSAGPGGYLEYKIYVGSDVINCNILDKNTYEAFLKELKKTSKKR